MTMANFIVAHTLAGRSFFNDGRIVGKEEWREILNPLVKIQKDGQNNKWFGVIASA